MVSRDDIVRALQALNAAENSRATSGVEAVSAGIDAVMSPVVEGWRNGEHVPNRAAERAAERGIFGAMADYHRDFDRLIVEPPFASLGWTIRGTIRGRSIVAPGCSQFEFGDDGRVRRYWLSFDPASFSGRTG